MHEFLNIRCPPDLKKRLRDMAERDHRKLADEARHLIELGLAEVERIGKGYDSTQAAGLKEFMEAAK